MKKIILIIIAFIYANTLLSQNLYWVYFTDKNGTTFNPYEYFDAKAIERRNLNHYPLDDYTDYPLNDKYKSSVSAFSEEMIGETRWFNAVVVSATEDNINLIKQLPFVREVMLIESEGNVTSYTNPSSFSQWIDKQSNSLQIAEQLQRFHGEKFVNAQIDGKGKRIAVFDAGFPEVNTHSAFKHLRDGHQIIKTWNFPKKEENVYGWNTHGTMVLSCIAGKMKEKLLGLATGAEFLLARTETDIEPRREEIWWVQAAEWADKNGADIISSSLGYGKARYTPEHMNGSYSIVSRAANMAASKGILVCNSMGNEASDNTWKVLITPADADSILSVGGINPNTSTHISFSSFGPTADGRLKPNVCAFGRALVAYKNDQFGQADGTSFSCPLISGFAACAWQSKPQFTAMQMKTEIEKAGDLYPYFDYAYGYGVPLADYFVNNIQKKAQKTFDFYENERSISIYIPKHSNIYDHLFFHIQGKDGVLKNYQELKLNDSIVVFDISKSQLEKGDIIRAHYKNYTEQIVYLQDTIKRNPVIHERIIEYSNILNEKSENFVGKKTFGVNAKWHVAPYLSWAFIAGPFQTTTYSVNYGRSESLLVGSRFKFNITKWYNMGVNVEFGSSFYNINSSFPANNILSKERIKTTFFNFEYFQRFRCFATETFGYGLYLDAGIYASILTGKRYDTKTKQDNITSTYSERKLKYINPINWGVRARIGYEIIALYAQYRISDIINNDRQQSNFKSDLPSMEFGLDLTIPLNR